MNLQMKWKNLEMNEMTDLEQQRAQLEGMVNTQIDPASGLAINCHNCIHCNHSPYGVDLDKCMKAGGTFCNLVHLYPLIHKDICMNYSAWAPRQKSILELIGDRIRKMLDT